MAVRATWHLPELDVDDGDPFEDLPAELPSPIEEVGVPITLDGEDNKAELSRALTHSLEAEAAFYAQGIRCELKLRPDTTCHACPLSARLDSRHQGLCRLGRRQEEIATELAVIDYAEQQ